MRRATLYFTLLGVLALSGCRTKRTVQTSVGAQTDTLTLLTSGQSVVEERDKHVQIEWWGAAADLPLILQSADTVTLKTPSGRGGMVLHVQEQRRMRRRDEQAINVRSEQKHTEKVTAPSPRPRGWWRIGIGIALLALIGWAGLRQWQKIKHFLH